MDFIDCAVVWSIMIHFHIIWQKLKTFSSGCEWLIYILTKLLQNISLRDGDLHRPLFSLIDFRSAWVWNFPSLIWSNPCEAIFFLNLKVKWDYSSLTLMIISSISRKCFFCFPCMIGHDFYCLLGIVCDREFDS